MITVEKVKYLVDKLLSCLRSSMDPMEMVEIPSRRLTMQQNMALSSRAFRIGMRNAFVP